MSLLSLGEDADKLMAESLVTTAVVELTSEYFVTTVGVVVTLTRLVTTWLEWCVTFVAVATVVENVLGADDIFMLGEIGYVSWVGKTKSEVWVVLRSLWYLVSSLKLDNLIWNSLMTLSCWSTRPSSISAEVLTVLAPPWILSSFPGLLNIYSFNSESGNWFKCFFCFFF